MGTLPIRHVPGTALEYYLVCYDEEGHERDDDPDGRMTSVLLDRLLACITPVTDVFLVSHGWKGDILSAIDQYDRWIKTTAQCASDVAAVKDKNPGFMPMIIALHWPSLPWGEEEFGGAGSYSIGGSALSQELVDAYVARLGRSAKARSALETIFRAASHDSEPDELPAEVIDAYYVLEREAGLKGCGIEGKPGCDHEGFDPEVICEEAQVVEAQPANFGGCDIGGLLLAPMRQLSFWKMKDRARSFGEWSAHSLIEMLQHHSLSRNVRFHAMGHSFGCIVVSGMLTGLPERNSLDRPVDSVFLVQGALSLWAYCSDIPCRPGKSGYFHSMIQQQRVNGPIVTTQSRFDTALGRIYPIGAGVKHQVSFAHSELPEYGALGTYGARGSGLTIVDQPMESVEHAYQFQHGVIYNLNSDAFIRNGGGLSGAHSDICYPEVAHAMWGTVLSH